MSAAAIVAGSVRWTQYSATVWLGTIGDDTRYRVLRLSGWWRVEIKVRTADWPQGMWLPLRCQRSPEKSVYRQRPARRFMLRSEAFTACEEHASGRAGR